jgi:hypothetical protein
MIFVVIYQAFRKILSYLVASIAMGKSSFVICYSYFKFLSILINDFNLSVRISKYDNENNGAFVFSAVKDCF